MQLCMTDNVRGSTSLPDRSYNRIFYLRSTFPCSGKNRKPFKFYQLALCENTFLATDNDRPQKAALDIELRLFSKRPLQRRIPRIYTYSGRLLGSLRLPHRLINKTNKKILNILNGVRNDRIHNCWTLL